MNKDYLTIKEVADIIGCSVQSVYNRLEKDFKPYLKIENKKKVLSKGVLDLIENPSISSDFKENFKDILKIFEKQLEEKDKQLDQKDNQIEQLQKLLDQQQQLTLLNKNRTLEIEEKSHWWKRRKL